MGFTPTFELWDLSCCTLGQTLMAGITGQSHSNPTAAQQKSNLLTTSILLDIKSTRGKGVKALAVTTKLLNYLRLTDKSNLQSDLKTTAEEKYLATKRNLNWNRDHLSQQTTIEGHHEGHWVIVREHQRHLGDGTDVDYKISHICGLIRTKNAS